MKNYFNFFVIIAGSTTLLHGSLGDKGPSYDAWLPQVKEHYKNISNTIDHPENGKELLSKNLKHCSGSLDDRRLKNLQKLSSNLTQQAPVFTFNDGVAFAGSFVLARALIRLFNPLNNITDFAEGFTFLYAFVAFCVYLKQIRDHKTKLNVVMSKYSEIITTITKKHVPYETHP